MARNDDEGPEKTGRIAQIRQTYKMARRSDRWVGWITLGILLGVIGLSVVVGIFVGPLWLWIIVGLPIALLGAAIVFGRRAERAAYGQIEGQPGAAAAALGTLRRGWDTTPMVGANRYQDVVHRAVGRPGIVLIGEGTSAGRVANLLAQEKKRHARVAPEMPVVEVIVGREDGQVPLQRLTRHLNKLPKNIRPAEVTELRARLRALGSTPIGIPKGPLPKGARIPRGTQLPGR
ncbi:DUF4191 domain-containing protein [Jiangella alkaliphila]|uniref:DUF4191 domain-containing protein n=1 Tax=Jiangella alkaliphila TaxID=419479 RepID=A0A1H2K9L3_9ACTN|nr:DUF4191 domain-containing protein [Jiangella alkaliphila]SDU65141.1 protein of unknown function [Jiangella alkaliphila]